MMLDKTLLGLLVRNATEMPDEVAIREKRFGVWKPMTWVSSRTTKWPS